MPDVPYRRLVSRVEAAISSSNRRSKGASREELLKLIDELKDAVSHIEASGWAQSVRARTGNLDERQGAAALWANCLGMIAGHYRRLGDLEAAFEPLEQGARLELDPELRMKSSYCATNRISMLIEAGKRKAADLSSEVGDAITLLKRQTIAGGLRATDPWAHADLAQLLLLQGDVAAAKSAYDNFAKLAKKPSEMDSALRVLNLLEQALEAMQDNAAEAVKSGAAYLSEKRAGTFKT